MSGMYSTNAGRRGRRDELRRGATIEGSRAFQHPETRTSRLSLVAERRLNGDGIVYCAGPIKRRYATHRHWPLSDRGLKPTATIMRSLRDQDIELADLNQVATQRRGFGRGATIEGSRAFQRPVGTPS